MYYFKQIVCFLMAMCVLTSCETEEFKNEPEHIHTVHHYHVKKFDVIKKIEVPVIKEIKVPYYVYVPIKYPYTYTVKPYVVNVPIEYYDTHTDEHGPVNVITPHEEDKEDHSEHNDQINDDGDKDFH